jgi:predicted esterase
MATKIIADVNCIEVWTGPSSSLTNLGVLLMHGYGADPSQFTAIVDVLLQTHPALATKRIRWIFPASPTQDGPVGSEWFPLDMMGWMSAFMGGEQVLADKLRETPTGMVSASEIVITLLAELLSTTDGAGSTLKGWCVGGFSQGSMMACSIVSRLPLLDQQRAAFSGATAPGGLLVLSGMPMNINEWSSGFQMQKGKDVQVLQLHGRSDMTCPFHSSGWLRDLMAPHMNVQYHVHNGAHDMGSTTEIRLIGEYLERLAN